MVGMSVRRTITVSITPEQDDLIRTFLRSGRFASTSEVVRAALRLLDRDEASVHAAAKGKPTRGVAARG
jgi:antitoxin ParD1/3/4